MIDFPGSIYHYYQEEQERHWDQEKEPLTSCTYYFAFDAIDTTNYILYDWLDQMINLLLGHLSYSSQTEFLENIYTFKSCNRSRMSYHTLRNEGMKRIVLHNSDHQCTCHRTHTTHTALQMFSASTHAHPNAAKTKRYFIIWRETFPTELFPKNAWVGGHTYNSILCKFVYILLHFPTYQEN